MLPSSKSISNRALIIQALCDDFFQINNLSEADDTRLLNALLEKIRKVKSGSEAITEIDAKNSGTTFRFLTAYLATKEGKWLLSGSERMKQRPIEILVDALEQLGAKITYTEKFGFPPLLIDGEKLKSNSLNLNAEISSQFISALLLIAPTLDHGLKIKLDGKIASEPFLDMTIKMMRYFGANVLRENNFIKIENQNYKPANIEIEADWTSASYWYEIVAFSEKAKIALPGLKKESLQGDSIIAEIFKKLGVHTEYSEDGVILSKINVITEDFNFEFSNYPDLAQTITVTCAGLNIKASLSGLENLKHKETDRLQALHNELQNSGFSSEVIDDSILRIRSKKDIKAIQKSLFIRTYDDHRMAMSFAPLVLLNKTLKIQKPEVVNKSYPDFWDDMRKLDIISY